MIVVISLALRNLQLFDLTSNNFKDLPFCVGQITSLRELLLTGNQLRELPPTLVRLVVVMLTLSWRHILLLGLLDELVETRIEAK